MIALLGSQRFSECVRALAAVALWVLQSGRRSGSLENGGSGWGMRTEAGGVAAGRRVARRVERRPHLGALSSTVEVSTAARYTANNTWRVMYLASLSLSLATLRL